MIRNLAAYRFVRLEDPNAVAAWVREWATRLQLRGTVLLAEEGINLFLAGPDAAIDAGVAALRGDPRFSAIALKYSRSAYVPFARLKVKVKPEIIRFGCDGIAPLRQRAPTVSACDLRRWIGRGGYDDAGRPLALLDTRNREEVGYGTFQGALTLPIDNFIELPAALSPYRHRLRDVTVVSFCTGGIRCEKAALWMRSSGMDNVLQLDGGILGYFEQTGGVGYRGRCFVFDQRIALDTRLRPLQAMPPRRGGAGAL